MRHITIVPARNEAVYIETTLDSLLNQTEPPDRIYVVDDGSSDETAEIVERIAVENAAVILVRKVNRGHRNMGGGVVETFNEAYELCRSEQFTYVSKIDADLILPSNYFETLLEFLDLHPNYAAASGTIYDKIGTKLMRIRMPENHVPGALKTIRKSVFDEIGGFQQILGWDIIDLAKMRLLGYETGHLKELEVTHLRQHGSAEGVLKGKAQWGRGAYAIGSHPLFVLTRGVYRMLEPPYLIGGLAFWWGYMKAAVTGAPQIADKNLIAALRREQLHRLTHLNRVQT